MSEVNEPTQVEETAVTAHPNSINDLEPKMKLTGLVTRLELYGAFIDIGVGTPALIHISQLGTEHINRVADVVSEGQEVTVWVDKVDNQRNQIMLTMIQPLAVDWSDLDKGQAYTGKVTRLETFGAFIDIGAEREGLVHISELSHNYVKHPSEVLTVGDEVQVEVLGFSKRKRRIDLSVKALLEKPEQAHSQVEAYEPQDVEEEEEDMMQTAMEFALRQALGSDMPSRTESRKHANKRNRKHKSRDQQEEIMSRTLQAQQQ
jgi:ribosomal protein S1